MRTILTIFLSIAGVVFIVIGISFFYLRYKFVSTSQKSIGVVVDTKIKYSKGMEKLFSPTIEFETILKEKIVFNNEKFWNKMYNNGDKIEIIYNPKQPNKAFINSFWVIYGGTFFILALGLITIVIALYWYFKK